MPRLITAASLFVFILGAALAPSFAAAPRKAAKKPAAKTNAAAKAGDFKRGVLPLTKKFCINCHGPTGETAGINFAKFATEESVVAQRGHWTRIVQSLRTKHMPPKNAAQPTDAERA